MDKKRLKDIMPKLKEYYPYVDEASIKKIVTKGCYRMHNFLTHGHEVMLENRSRHEDRSYYLRIYEPMGVTQYNEKAKTQAARKNKLRNERKAKRAAQLSKRTAD